MAGSIDFIADTSAIIGMLRRDATVEHKIAGKNFAITFVTLGGVEPRRPEVDATGGGMVAHSRCDRK